MGRWVWSEPTQREIEAGKAALDEIVEQHRRLVEQLEAAGVEYVCAHDHKWHTLGLPTRCPMCNTSTFAASSPATRRGKLTPKEEQDMNPPGACP